MKENNQTKKIQSVSIILAGIIWAFWILKKGVKFSPDSGSYSYLGDLLIKYDFNYFNFLANTEDVAPIALYSAWVSIVAISKVILSDKWGVGIVVINYIAAIYILVLTLKITNLVNRNFVSIIFASLALICCYEFFMWTHYVLSDILFAAISFSIIFLSISLFQEPTRPQKRIASGLILFAIALFFRPASPPLVVFIFLAILFGFFFKLGSSDENKRNRLIFGLTLFSCIAIISVLFFHSHIMLEPENWPFSFFKTWIAILANDYKLGVVVFDRPETFLSIPTNIFDYLFITLCKFISFFSITFNGYSKIHSFFNYLFFAPIYLLSLFSIVLLYKKHSGLSTIKWWTIFLCFIYIVLFAFFHSLNQIDYDLRYRVPCLPPLVLLATIGFNELMTRFFKKASNKEMHLL